MKTTDFKTQEIILGIPYTIPVIRANKTHHSLSLVLHILFFAYFRVNSIFIEIGI